jgi:sporulation protein YlmC with PRC-barrel domain
MARTAFCAFATTTLVAAATALSATAFAQIWNAPANAEMPATRPDLTGQVSSLNADLLYRGWRARSLFGQAVSAKSDGREVGWVRDVIVDRDGRAAALVVEGGGTLGLPEAVYRVPWSNVDLTPGKAGVRIDLASGSEKPQYGLFPGTEGVATLPREFRLTEILGDYARLQSGYGYGVVMDSIFTPDGRMSAVLVTRDGASGGGTTAFPFYGTSGPWDPGMSYYGLPFVTEDQARAAGLKVDPQRFSTAVL